MELKALKIGDLCFDFKSGKMMACDYYLKPEADRYIAHHKYKRCLAIADLCFRDCQTYRALIERGEEHFSKMDFYGRWNKIWLILAEKFKEAK